MPHRILKFLKQILFKIILFPKAIRRRIIFELKQNYFDDLDIKIPLDFNLQCPLYIREATLSFSEIFITLEYKMMLEKIPLPNTWIDIGCHLGYFSLWVALLRARQGLDTNFKALLIDADSRSQKAVDNLISINNFQNQMVFKQGLISQTKGTGIFFERLSMGSSVSSYPEPGVVTHVPTITTEDIIGIFPPPYDLIKVDVEGNEYDFLMAYEPVFTNSRHLILEWHSFHSGGGDYPQICQLVKEKGFNCLLDYKKWDIPLADKHVNAGILLLEKRR